MKKGESHPAQVSQMASAGYPTTPWSQNCTKPVEPGFSGFIAK